MKTSIRTKIIEEQVHAEPETKLTVSRGHGAPFGATVRPGGVNFAVFARHAERVHLVLSRQGHVGPVAEIPLDPWLNKTGDVWHVFVH
ncbi:MAG: glycogen debranching enzyme, partial [Isosphaeraceae bacterium]